MQTGLEYSFLAQKHNHLRVTEECNPNEQIQSVRTISNTLYFQGPEHNQNASKNTDTQTNEKVRRLCGKWKHYFVKTASELHKR